MLIPCHVKKLIPEFEEFLPRSSDSYLCVCSSVDVILFWISLAQSLLCAMKKSATSNYAGFISVSKNPSVSYFFYKEEEISRFGKNLIDFLSISDW